MQIVPWKQISSWRCNHCGVCCVKDEVILKFPEWLDIIKNFGAGFTAAGVSQLFLGKRPDGSCKFLYKTPRASFCSLQRSKPQACKLWPFKVLDRPKYGKARNASYQYGHHRIYIYADTACRGLSFGSPTYVFTHSVVPEFIEIAFGMRRRQVKSTAIPVPFL